MAESGFVRAVLGSYQTHGMLVFLVLGSLAMRGTFHHIRFWFNNRTCIDMALPDYLRGRPEGQWVRLGQSYADPAEAAYAYLNNSNKIIAAYLPVRERDDHSMPVCAVWEITDESRIRSVYENARLFAGPLTIEGAIAEYGPPQEAYDAHWKMTQGVVVIRDQDIPSMRRIAVFAALFVAFLIWVIAVLRERRRSQNPLEQIAR